MSVFPNTAAGATPVVEPTTHQSASAGSREPTYGEILRLDELLTMQTRLSDLPDELFFLIAHQVSELWFKTILDELGKAREAMFAGEIPRTLYALRRVDAIERVLVAQVETLETISPGSFVRLRHELLASSGFQSAQFREIEFLSGLKDATYLDRVEVTVNERRRLERRLSEPTVWDSFITLIGGESNLSGLHELLRCEVPTSDIVAVAEALLDHDERCSLWRTRHVHMVERIIGSKPGTGGSSGVSYLRATIDKRFFPLLWDARSKL